MANITITVQSLLNTAVYDSYTIDNGQTVDQLKTAINTAKGFDSTWYDIVQGQHLAAGGSTLASLGIVTGTALRTHNKIAHLANRELRQKAKLDLAALDRTSTNNPRDDYDLSQLPTQYYGDLVVNNNNAGGLVEGRPWIAGGATLKYANGLYARTYSGYFNDVTTWFATASQTAAAATTSLTIPSVPSNTSIQFLGYFLPRTTEAYTFGLDSDDSSYAWVGSNAVSGFTTGNALTASAYNTGEVFGTINLTAGIYYPVRIQYGNGAAGGRFNFSFSTPSIAKTSTWTDFIFYNTGTNGL